MDLGILMKTNFVCYLFILTVLAHNTWAKTLYMDLNNQTGKEDGSQARPYNTTQEAIDNASENNTILVLPRVYSGLGNVELSSNFELELGLMVTGRYISASQATHWDGKTENRESVASGTYFYQLQAGNYLKTKRW